MSRDSVTKIYKMNENPDNPKCIVKRCVNHKNQGKFIGDICVPCHETLITGKISPSTTFIYDLFSSLNYCKRRIEDLEQEVKDVTNLDNKSIDQLEAEVNLRLNRIGYLYISNLKKDDSNISS